MEKFKHFKLKVVDNVGVITIDSPGVKVRSKVYSTFCVIKDKL